MADLPKAWIEVLAGASSSNNSIGNATLYTRANKEIDRLDAKIQRNINKYVA